MKKLKINTDIRIGLVFSFYLCLSHSFIGTSDEPESLNITRYHCYHRSSVTLTEGSTTLSNLVMFGLVDVSTWWCNA